MIIGLLLFSVLFLNVRILEGSPEKIIYGYQGGNIILPCPIPLSDTITDMRWYQENGYTKTLYDITRSVHKPLSSRYTASRESGALTIHNVTIHDGSIYKCTVVDGDYIKDSYVTLKVLNRSEVFPSVVKTSIGSTITIKCPIPSTDPADMMLWTQTREGRTYDIVQRGHFSVLNRYSADSETGSLTIFDVKQQDAGVFKCTILQADARRESFVILNITSSTNPPGHQTGSLRFTHMYFQQPGFMFHYPLSKESLLKPGYVIIIDGCAEGYTTQPYLQWYRNNELMTNYENDHQIHKHNCDGRRTRLRHSISTQDNDVIISIKATQTDDVTSTVWVALDFPLTVGSTDKAGTVLGSDNYDGAAVTWMFIMLVCLILIQMTLYFKCVMTKLSNKMSYTKGGKSYSTTV